MKIYIAVCTYAAEHGSPQVEFAEAFKTKEEAFLRCIESIAREYETGEDCKPPTEDMLVLPRESLRDRGEYALNYGDGVNYNWKIVQQELPL